MSVTMHLFKPRPDVIYNGEWWMQLPLRELSHETLMDLQVKLGGPSEPPEDAPNEVQNDFFLEEMEWDKKMKEKSFSDGKNHELVELDAKKAYLRQFRGGTRMLNRLQKFQSRHFEVPYYRFNYLVLDQVEYRQGWFLKKRFFQKKFWTIYCTTRKELEEFFKRYVNLNDEWGREARDAFLNAWEDGMLFACLF